MSRSEIVFAVILAAIIVGFLKHSISEYEKCQARGGVLVQGYPLWACVAAPR